MAENKTRFANRYGQLYYFVKEKITSLSELCPGDHIAVERYKLFWHHMIVEDIDHNAKTIHVIHYYNTMKEFFETFPYKACVRRDEVEFTPNELFRILYEEEQPNPDEKVLEKARARIGEKKYNSFLNNCEHFCTECKINVAASQQVHVLTDVLFRNLNTAVSEMICLLAKKSALVLSKAAVLGVTAGVVVLSIAFGAVVAAKDIYEACEKYETKKISYDHFTTSVESITVVLASTGAISILGIFIGQALIPVPFVGAMVGGFLGHLLGMLLSVTAMHLVPLAWNCVKRKFKKFRQWLCLR